MTTLELIVRTSACAAALILAVALFRARHAALASRLFGPALCLGVAGGLLLLAIGVAGMSTASPGFHAVTVTLHSILGIGFVVSALVNVLRGWRQDLVEARRRLRAAILVSSGAYSITIMSVELVLRGRPPSAEILLLNALLLAALLLGLACFVLDIGPGRSADPHDGARGRVRFHSRVQSSVQGSLWPDALGVSSRCPRRGTG